MDLVSSNTRRGGILARALDHLFFFRPLLLLPIWAPLLLGYWGAGGRESDPKYLLLLILGFFLGGWIYGLNQIFDIEGDRINRKNLPLPLGLVSKKTAWAISIASLLVAMAAGFFIGIWCGLFTAVGGAMGLAYSYPTLRFKDKPWPALLLNGLGHGSLVYAIGWSAGGPLKWMLLFRMLPFAFAFAGVYIATTIPDIVGDRRTKKITLAVSMGEKRASIVALGLIAIGAIAGIFLSEPALSLTGLFAAPFYIIAMKKGGDSFVRANKMAVLFLNLWICFYFLSYSLVLVVVIVGSRLYNSRRLGVKYP